MPYALRLVLSDILQRIANKVSGHVGNGREVMLYYKGVVSR